MSVAQDVPAPYTAVHVYHGAVLQHVRVGS
jgi:hypothetical protein